MILCDTNILIEFYKNNAPITAVLRAIGPENLAISAVTAAELYYGALNQQELRQIKAHLGLLNTYHITLPISNRFLALMEAYVLSHKLSLPDALIAATALDHDVELYTLNRKDFRYIPELKLFSPMG
jgi:tRNA(fMet)-specific endonuclease VapC